MVAEAILAMFLHIMQHLSPVIVNTEWHCLISCFKFINLAMKDMSDDIQVVTSVSDAAKVYHW